MRFKYGIKEKNVIVKCGADNFLPFAVTFGLYIILFGTISQGGGFQGGVIVASAALLLYLGYGFRNAKKAVNMEVLRVNEAVGATLYVILGLCGLIAGANFCRNIFFDNGQVGDLVSAGTISFMGWAVGYKVLTGVGFLLLLMLGLLAPDEEAREKKDAEFIEKSRIAIAEAEAKAKAEEEEKQKKIAAAKAAAEAKKKAAEAAAAKKAEEAKPAASPAQEEKKGDA